MRMSNDQADAFRVQIIAEALAVHIVTAPDGEVYADKDAPLTEKHSALQRLTNGDHRGIIEFIAPLISDNVVPMSREFKQLCVFIALANGCSYTDVNRLFGMASSHISRTVNQQGTRDEVGRLYDERRRQAAALLGVSIINQGG